MTTPELKSEWLKADASSALAVLTAAGPRAEALVQAWTQGGNAAAIVEVADHGAGPARKAARRALNVLKARGVAVPEKKRVATLAAAAPDATLRASLVPPDGGGTTVLVFESRAGGERYQVVFAFVSEAGFLVRCEPATQSAAQLKETLGRLLPSGVRPTPVPLEWARHRVAVARAKNVEAKIPLPLGVTTSLPLIEPAPSEAPTHPFDEEGLVVADDDVPVLAKGSRDLHALIEFRSWIAPLPAVEELLREVGKTLEPGQQPEQAMVNERLTEQIAAATDRFFTPERRSYVVSAMKDAAVAVLAREGEERALEVAATMAAIGRCGLITDPPREVPFLVGFFEKGVSVMAARSGGRLDIPIPAAAP